MLQKTKLALRRTSAAFDDEIKDLIAAAVQDLRNVGVTKLPATIDYTVDSFGDPLIDRAVILYCKAEFGYLDVNEAKRFRDAYDYLKCALSLAGDYIVTDDDT